MSFEQLFFKSREGKTFFQVNNGSSEKKAYLQWLGQIPTQDIGFVEALTSSDSWQVGVMQSYVKHFYANRTENYGYVSITRSKTLDVSFEVPHFALASATSRKAYQLNKLTDIQVDQVNERYNAIISELVNFVLASPNYNKRALDELHTYYNEDVIENALAIHKGLSNPGYDHFDADITKYCESMSKLLVEYFEKSSENDLMKSSLVNLHLLLVYQANHPDMFKESFKETFTRYLSKTLTVIFWIMTLATMILVIATPAIIGLSSLLFMFSTFIFSTEAIVAFGLSAATFTGMMYGLNLFETHIKDKTECFGIGQYVYSGMSNFFYPAFEKLFNCKVHEFEMTRIIEKGKAFVLPEEVEQPLQFEDPTVEPDFAAVGMAM